MSKDILSPQTMEVIHSYPGSYATAMFEPNTPALTRIVGLKVLDPATVRFMTPTSISGEFIEALNTTPRAAIVGVNVTNYMTFQFKGEVTAVRDANDADLEVIADYREQFCALVAHVGIDPVRYGPSFSSPPYTTFDLKVTDVFDQTPRVGAGERIAGGEQ